MITQKYFQLILQYMELDGSWACDPFPLAPPEGFQENLKAPKSGLWPLAENFRK